MNFLRNGLRDSHRDHVAARQLSEGIFLEGPNSKVELWAFRIHLLTKNSLRPFTDITWPTFLTLSRPRPLGWVHWAEYWDVFKRWTSRSFCSLVPD
jgi:hypothetical protein